MTRLTAAGRKVQCEARHSKPCPNSLAAAPRIRLDGSETSQTGKPYWFLDRVSGCHEARRVSKRSHIGKVRCQRIRTQFGSEETQQKARGPECTRRSAPQHQDPSAAQAAQPNQMPRSKARRSEQRIGLVRCGASGWHKHTEQACLPGPSSHNAGDNASASNAASATSSATRPVGRERDLLSCQNALANGAARYQVARFFSANPP